VTKLPSGYRKFGQTELARSEVSFNPYTLRLAAQDLRLAEAAKRALYWPCRRY